MDGLQFQTATAPARSDPARTDIACFVGFVDTRLSDPHAHRSRMEQALRSLGWDGDSLQRDKRVLPGHVLPSGDSPDSFANWLIRRKWERTRETAVSAPDLFAQLAGKLLNEAVVEWWRDNAWLTPFSGCSAADLLELQDVPVPIDTWDAFDSLFAWERRPLARGGFTHAVLGTAIRRFFAQGGRKCYVVRVGNTWAAPSPLAARATQRASVMRPASTPNLADRLTWRGVGHLLGLPDASFLCVPDLPELFAADQETPPVEPVADTPETFKECADPIVAPPERNPPRLPGPRCDDDGFRNWSVFVRRIGSLIERDCREIQFVAAIPLAVNAFPSRIAQWQHVASIQTAFVQLAYPWLRTRESRSLADGLEPPDAMLAGLLANNALTRGTWRSAARAPLHSVTDVEPALSIAELDAELPYHGTVGRLRAPHTVRERVSVLGPTADGFRLLSDVTTDDDEAYRPANVNRLTAAIVRAARLVGENVVFGNSGEALWRPLRSALEDLLLGLWGEGALSGASSSEAFTVQCDRSTMTQADIDAARVIARVQFLPARPIQQIVVVLAMDEGGRVTLASGS